LLAGLRFVTLMANCASDTPKIIACHARECEHVHESERARVCVALLLTHLLHTLETGMAYSTEKPTMMINSGRKSGPPPRPAPAASMAIGRHSAVPR